jgi:anti-sigma factor RsiW
MTRDDLEFSISQYLDGTLAPAERDALETRLGSDAEARALYAEYEALQGVIAAAPLPPVRWDRLAGHLSAAVAAEAEPAQSYRLSRWLRPARLALAASVLLAGGVSFSVWRWGSESTTTTALDPVPPAPISIVLKDTPAAPAASSEPAAVAANDRPVQVAVGAPPNAGDAAVVRLVSDSVVRRPSKAVIVSTAAVGQDGFQTPF